MVERGPALAVASDALRRRRSCAKLTPTPALAEFILILGSPFSICHTTKLSVEVMQIIGFDCFGAQVALFSNSRRYSLSFTALIA